MNTIKIDTEILVKEEKYLDTLIIKKKVNTKEYFLHINYEPVATRKEYQILITIVKKLKSDVENIETDITTKREEDKTYIIYKPKGNRLYYWEKLLTDYIEEQLSVITTSHKSYSLQTKDTNKVHNIFEYNKSLVLQTLKEDTIPEAITSEYNDLIPVRTENKVSYFTNIEYFIYKKFLPSISVIIYPQTKEIELLFPKLDIDIYRIEVYFLNKMVYVYNESSKPIKDIKTKFTFDNLNQVLKTPYIKMKIKGYYLSKHYIDIDNIFLINLKTAKLSLFDSIEIKLDKKVNYLTMNNIRNIFPISFGNINDIITVLLESKKSYGNYTAKKISIVKYSEEYTDDITINLENEKRNYFTYMIIRNSTG